MNNRRAFLQHPDQWQKFLTLLNGMAMLLIAVSYNQQPLYYSNQNTYFLHGMAQSQASPLRSDWLAQTADPTPLFSAFVKLTLEHFNRNFFYLSCTFLVFLFIYACLGIVSLQQKSGPSSLKYWGTLSVVAALYSGLIFNVFAKAPFLKRVAYTVSPEGLFSWGLASQYVLGPMLQPSVFGVFIALSIYFFLRERLYYAIVCLAIASNFHPTYLLTSLLFFFSYLLSTVKKRSDFKMILGPSVLLFLLNLPLLIYVSTHFRATSPQLTERARNILFDFRIPHHANPLVWFHRESLFQLFLISLAIYVTRRTKLGTILFFPFLFSTLLTLLQIVSGNKALALLFPWRVSVILVPLSTVIIVSYFWDFVTQKVKSRTQAMKGFVYFSIFFVFSFSALHAYRNWPALLKASKNEVDPLVAFAEVNHQADDQYLVPLAWGDFRLKAQTPIFVDGKSHPYQDFELVEWFKRINLAKDFYQLDAKSGCRALGEMARDYRLTHVVVRRDYQVSNCGMLQEIYGGQKYKICKIAR